MRTLSIVLFFLTMTILLQHGSAQGDPKKIIAQLREGEQTINITDSRPLLFDMGYFNNRLFLMITEKNVYIDVPLSSDDWVLSHVFTAPNETRIIDAKFKSNDANRIVILLSDGTMMLLEKKIFWTAEKIILPPALANPQKIEGDALYILKQGKVYASWDTAKTWSIDSTNIGPLTVKDIAVDTNHYGWVITQDRKLFFQHPDSSVWHWSTAFSPSGIPQSIFIDRRGRMFISTNQPSERVLVSTNTGASWEIISTGIDETILSFGDDSFGNIYAVGTQSKAYRLSQLTPPWISISDSLNAVAYLPSNAKVINAIKGDSILFAATRYGMFHSTDFGANWTHSGRTKQIVAHTFYSGIIGSSTGHKYVSSNLGIYRIASGDSVWNKVFPKSGFIWGVNAIASDSAGTLYVNFPIKTGPLSSLFFIVRSTDQGETWVLDTAGFNAVGLSAGTQQYDLFVEQQGMLYLGGNGILISKKPGGVWKRDTAGLGIKSGEFVADVSLNNAKGITYIARRTGIFPNYSLGVYQRSNGDSVWKVVNTAALATSEGRLVSDHEGNIIVRTLSGSYKFWKYDGTNWTDIPLPAGLGSNPFAQRHVVNRSGVLWATFFGSGLNQGVYFTTNGGAQWKYAGLKGVGIKTITAVNDTVYAVTFIDGVFGFTTSTLPLSSDNRSSEQVSHYMLMQNYPNPFNPSTNIRFGIPVSGVVTLKIYDVLGREISTLVNGHRQAGEYDESFHGMNLSSGIYFYRLTAGEFSMTKRFILQK